MPGIANNLAPSATSDEEKIGFHRLEEKKAAEKQAKRVEALKRLGKAH